MEYDDKMMKYYLNDYCASLTTKYIMQTSKEKIKKQATILINKKIIKQFDVENDDLLKNFIDEQLTIIKKCTYEENEHILNFINYRNKGYILKNILNMFKNVEIDKLWLLSETNKEEIDNLINSANIKDYIKLNTKCTTKGNTNDVRADTIFSAWYPIRRIIEILFEKEFEKKIIQNQDSFTFIKDHLSEIKNQKSELYKALSNFTKAASTRGNVIKYPYYPNHPNKINNFQNRGSESIYQDLFLISLKECFDDGIYSILFKNGKSNYKSIHEWINDQKLYCFFKNGKKEKYKANDIIEIENENKIVQNSDTKNWNETNIDDMIVILNVYTEIINERNNNL